MKKFTEKKVIRYVVASIDNTGKTIYLRSLHDYKWEIVTDIEVATKANSRAVAAMIYENYKTDMNGAKDESWVVIPLEICWNLIDER